MKNAKVLILTDDPEFAGLLSSCWPAERHAPSITVLNSSLWKAQGGETVDLVVLGPVSENKLSAILSTLHPGVAVILCAADSREIQQLHSRYPRLLHVPLREDWTQTLVLVALQSEREAVLGRYMSDMKHSVNNALTTILGNAELLLLEPGQLSAQSLQQIKTMHSMTLRINEIMQRFSSLASEMREAENASQAETDEAPASLSTRN